MFSGKVRADEIKNNPKALAELHREIQQKVKGAEKVGFTTDQLRFLDKYYKT